MTFVGPVELSCGHTHEKPRCHQVRNEEAMKRLSKQCKARMTVTFKTCGHTVETSCSNARSDNPFCPAICGEKMECGHPCRQRCGKCEENHKCNMKCEKRLFCGHYCGSECHLPNKCAPCNRKCEVKCVHSKCSRPCHEPCDSCVEPCVWECEHQGKCPLVCGAPCSRLPCNLRCKKKLACGHQCPSVCGEDCPPKKFCQICCKPDIKNRVVDMISLSSYEEHDVDDDPLIFLQCGHFFSMTTLDACFNLSDVYEKDLTTGEFIATIPIVNGNVDGGEKRCPECRQIVQTVYRYGRIFRFMELRGLERKHSAHVEQSIEDCLKFQPARIIKQMSKILKQIEEGPMKRVYEACGGDKQVEIFPPSPRLLLRVLELSGQSHCELVEKADDKHFKEAESNLTKAVEVADASKSLKSSTNLRLRFATLLVQWKSEYGKTKERVDSLVNRIIKDATKLKDNNLIEQAKKLKGQFEAPSKEMMTQIIKAMNKHDKFGNCYGSDWASHWYQCPNGHPYFIGECGGAMVQSTCVECGAPVGGGDHQLLTSNSRAAGLVHEILTNT